MQQLSLNFTTFQYMQSYWKTDSHSIDNIFKQKQHIIWKPIWFCNLVIKGQIKQACDSGEYAFGLFLYLQKAFDCVNHDILLTVVE